MELRHTPRGDPYYRVVSEVDLPTVAAAIGRGKRLGLDIETTSLDPYLGEIRLVQLHVPDQGTFGIDMFQTRTLGPVLDAICDEKILKLGQNLKFEQKWFTHKFKRDIWPLFDTYRASALIHNGKDLGHNLYDVYARELGLFPSTDDFGASDWSGLLADQQWDYAIDDVTAMPALYEKLRPQLKELGLLEVALLEFGAILPESEVELTGFLLDRDRWTPLAQQAERTAATLRKKLLKDLPNPSKQLVFLGMEPPFNLDSTDQMLASLQKLGVTETITSADGATSITVPLTTTREIVLAGMAKEYPVIQDIFKYREAKKQGTTYGEDFLKHIHKMTGRIHCSYFPFTEAGRYASSRPNLQNIPRDKRYRSCFVARKGYKLIGCDFSGVEMRVIADLANDEVLIGIFDRGEDAHYFTAASVARVAYDQVTKNQRQQAKAINFGFMYGMGFKRFVLYALANYGVVVSLAEAEEFRKAYFRTYKQIKRWQKDTIAEGQSSGLAHTVAGRRRVLPKDAYSEYLNTPVQGTATGDAIKKALRAVLFMLRKLGVDTRMVHHVHDEILVEVIDELGVPEMVAGKVRETMIGALQPWMRRVPIDAEYKIGYDWAEVH